MSENESKKRLTKEQREEVTRRVVAGESQSALAAEFGCTRAYVSLLKMQALHPERETKKRERKLTKMLTEEQLERLKEAIRTSNPYELKLEPPIRAWDGDHVEQLSQRWFEKKPSTRIIKECLKCIPVRKHDPLFCRPRPPEKHHISQLSRELAQDKDYVRYYLSPQAEKLAWRQYELALADWQSRFGDAEVAYPEDYPVPREDEDGMDFPTPKAAGMPSLPYPQRHGQRVGKHAKNKAQPKRKKRKGKRR
jgi:transposase